MQAEVQKHLKYKTKNLSNMQDDIVDNYKRMQLSEF